MKLAILILVLAVPLSAQERMHLNTSAATCQGALETGMECTIPATNRAGDSATVHLSYFQPDPKKRLEGRIHIETKDDVAHGTTSLKWDAFFHNISTQNGFLVFHFGGVDHTGQNYSGLFSVAIQSANGILTAVAGGTVDFEVAK